LIERIIENWLSNTNERGYEIPFCQYLISKGHKVLWLSIHGPMEQGKDIITIDKKGVPCAFQLKSGYINDNVWGKIKREIEDLIEIPINYPGLDKKVQHRSILVTNSTMSPDVKDAIDDRNLWYKQRGRRELELILGRELLGNFLEVNGTFLPSRLPDMKSFLELFLFEGKELLSKDAFANFIETLLLAEDTSNIKLQRKIANAILLTQYLMEPYELQKNHISIIEGWVILYSYILALVEKNDLPEKSWLQSQTLVMEKINYQLRLLKDEFLSKTDYLEDGWDGGLYYKARLTIVVGWLSAYELHMKEADINYHIDDRIYTSIKKLYQDMWFWGESATPLFLMMSKVCEAFGDSSFSYRIICKLAIELAFRNRGDEKNCLPNPYISIQQVINHFYGHSDEKLDLETFSGESYHLPVLVDALVRRNRRDLLNEFWKETTHIINSEFKTESKWKLLKWHCEEGSQVNYFYEKPQSWKMLKEKAFKLEKVCLPSALIKSRIPHYFLIAYPHRLTSNTYKLIDLPKPQKNSNLP
jgi:hypothetical protein